MRPLPLTRVGLLERPLWARYEFRHLGSKSKRVNTNCLSIWILVRETDKQMADRSGSSRVCEKPPVSWKVRRRVEGCNLNEDAWGKTYWGMTIEAAEEAKALQMSG